MDIYTQVDNQWVSFFHPKNRPTLVKTPSQNKLVRSESRLLNGFFFLLCLGGFSRKGTPLGPPFFWGRFLGNTRRILGGYYNKLFFWSRSRHSVNPPLCCLPHMGPYFDKAWDLGLYRRLNALPSWENFVCLFVCFINPLRPLAVFRNCQGTAWRNQIQW